MAHLPNCKVKIVLQNVKGETWTVNSVPSTRVHTSHTLCGGWMAFVRYNDIKIGDICIFELVAECEFHVHIRRVGKEGVDCQSGKVTSSRLGAGHGVTSHKSFKALPKKMRGNSSKVHMKSIKMLDVSDKKVSKKLLEAAFPNDTKKHGSTSKTLTKVVLSSQSKAASKKMGKGSNYLLRILPRIVLSLHIVKSLVFTAMSFFFFINPLTKDSTFSFGTNPFTWDNTFIFSAFLIVTHGTKVKIITRNLIHNGLRR